MIEQKVKIGDIWESVFVPGHNRKPYGFCMVVSVIKSGKLWAMKETYVYTSYMHIDNIIRGYWVLTVRDGEILRDSEKARLALAYFVMCQ